MKYKKNLKINGNKVYSYNTHVATIDRDDRKLLIHGYWSKTTSEHVNHVASEYGLTKVQGEKNDSEKNSINDLKSIGMVAMFGNILCNTQKEKNDWKLRMLKAGLEKKGLDIPDDWAMLSEDEKEKRLTKVLEVVSQ